jgi:predicted DNA-binding transcriptional regulator AlpA
VRERVGRKNHCPAGVCQNAGGAATSPAGELAAEVGRPREQLLGAAFRSGGVEDTQEQLRGEEEPAGPSRTLAGGWPASVQTPLAPFSGVLQDRFLVAVNDTVENRSMPSASPSAPVPPPGDRFMRPPEAAAACAVSRRTLDRWRRAQIAPPAVRIRGRLYYLHSELMSWLRKQGRA